MIWSNPLVRRLVPWAIGLGAALGIATGPSVAVEPLAPFGAPTAYAASGYWSDDPASNSSVFSGDSNTGVRFFICAAGKVASWSGSTGLCDGVSSYPSVLLSGTTDVTSGVSTLADMICTMSLVCPGVIQDQFPNPATDILVPHEWGWYGNGTTTKITGTDCFIGPCPAAATPVDMTAYPIAAFLMILVGTFVLIGVLWILFEALSRWLRPF